MRTRLRLCLAALAIVLLVAGVLTVTLHDTETTAAARSDSVTTQQTDPSTSSTTTTLDPAPFEYAAALQRAEVGQFLEQWHNAEVLTFLQSWQAAEQQAAADRARAAAVYRAPTPVAPQWKAPASTPAKPSTGGSSPGGFLACVRKRESGGSYTAVNPSSGAGGAYQFLPSTWHAIGGTGLPQNASPAEQDAMAQKLYAGGAGAGHWAGGQYAC